MCTDILTTALGVILGAIVSIIITVLIEGWKKPHLRLSIEEKPLDRTYPMGLAAQSRFLRVEVTNQPMPRWLRWLGRSAAFHCTGHVQFHHLEDGVPVSDKVMPMRWSGSEEPFRPSIPPAPVEIDQTKWSAAFYRDCFPGDAELGDIAARFDEEEECFGWSNDSYLTSWRNPLFQMGRGRYLVKVTIRSSGETVSRAFQLENSSTRENFRLLPATKEQADKLQPLD